MNILPIVITPGEPAGIGPDLVLAIAQQSLAVPMVVIADADCLQSRAQRLDLAINITRIDE